MFSESENVLFSPCGLIGVGWGGGWGFSGNFRKGHGRKVEKFVG